MIRISNCVHGYEIKQESFYAKSFDEGAFKGLIDPVVMVDHFEMIAPTFGPHPHAGIYAITYMFEDSTTCHMNQDNLGCFTPINPGSLHLFLSGSGAIHTEQPEVEGKKVHALQIFYNLAADRKFTNPEAHHLDSKDIVEFNTDGVRVRVVCGESNGIVSQFTPPDKMGILDCFVKKGKRFTHQMPKGWHAIYMSIQGDITIAVDGKEAILKNDTSIGIGYADKNITAPYTITATALEDCHFAILSGHALNEPIYKHGPFVMNTKEQMMQVQNDFQSGRMGALSFGKDKNIHFTKPVVLL